MTPGELLIDAGEHTLNPGRRCTTVVVHNTASRPIQVGSHYHFAETNAALGFDRAAANGMRLNIAAGTAVWKSKGLSALPFTFANNVKASNAAVDGAAEIYGLWHDQNILIV